jgi:hypothetical protein
LYETENNNKKILGKTMLSGPKMFMHTKEILSDKSKKVNSQKTKIIIKLKSSPYSSMFGQCRWSSSSKSMQIKKNHYYPKLAQEIKQIRLTKIIFRPRLIFSIFIYESRQKRKQNKKTRFSK